MFRIKCPWCGPRNQDEFSFGGEISAQPLAWDAPLAGTTLADYLFMRDNVRGVQLERWLHSSCGQWLRVSRSTADHTIFSAELARQP